MFGNLETLPPDPILGVTAAFRAIPIPTRSTSASASIATISATRRSRPRSARPSGEVLAAQATQDLRRSGSATWSSTSASSRSRSGRSPARSRSARPRSRPWAVAARCGSAPSCCRGLDRAPSCTSAIRRGRTTSRWSAAPGSRCSVTRTTTRRRRSVAFEPMLEQLERLPAEAVVLLHGCCHNPTGVDL